MSSDRLTLALASLYLRHAPTETGRWRLINHFLPRLRQQGAMLGERIVSTRYGFKFNADLGDWLGQYVYLTGVYEPPTARVIAALLHAGDTMLDIGANVGFFSLLGANRVGPAGQVLSFEPIPAVREQLRRNITLNRFGNIKVFDVACSDQPGEFDMYEGPAGHKGLSSLRPLEKASQKVTVRVVRLDDMLDELPCIRLIKIDVEGAEQNALLGMRDLLARDKPDLVVEITEGYLQQFRHSAEELVSWLTHQGYNAYRIEEKKLIPFEAPIPRNWPDQFNALFTQATLLPEPLNKDLHGS